MYDLNFIFDECGFRDVPEYIDRDRLFNVSFDIHTEEIKLYVLDKGERFAYKLSQDGTISRQYSGGEPQYEHAPQMLRDHFQRKLDFTRIVIDAVEDDVYYIYLDDGRAEECMEFIDAICVKYDITGQQFLDAINAVNERKFISLRDGVLKKALSLVKVPLTVNKVKIYSRPFYTGHGFKLNTVSREFLARVFNCNDEKSLQDFLKYVWVAKEISTGRMQVVTQYHKLLHTD